jgi:hypothetical protein
MDMEKIAYWARVPRPLTAQIEEISVRPFGIMKKANRKWEEEMAHCPLVFVGVVQANRVLFDPATSQLAPAVITFTTDPRHALDAAFIQKVAARIIEAKEQGSPDPAAVQLGNLLRNENSNFFKDVPPSLSDGVAARVHVTYLKPEMLPGRIVPDHRLLPAIATPKSVHYLPPAFYL